MKTSIRGWLVLLTVILSALNPVLRADELAEAEKQIKAHELYDLCRVMASREFSGRLSGHAGYTKAAQWAAGKFKEWGLRPLGQKANYLQAYPSPYSVLESAELAVDLLTSAGRQGNGRDPAESRINPGFSALGVQRQRTAARGGRGFLRLGDQRPGNRLR
jgi:hypothetical protein